MCFILQAVCVSVPRGELDADLLRPLGASGPPCDPRGRRQAIAKSYLGRTSSRHLGLVGPTALVARQSPPICGHHSPTVLLARVGARGGHSDTWLVKHAPGRTGIFQCSKAVLMHPLSKRSKYHSEIRNPIETCMRESRRPKYLLVPTKCT